MHLFHPPWLGLPDPFPDQQLPQCFPAQTNLQILLQILGRQRRPEIPVVRLECLHHSPRRCCRQPPFRLPASQSMHHRSVLVLSEPLQQFPKPALAHPQLLGSLPLLQVPALHFMQHLQPIPLFLAQTQPLLFVCQLPLAHSSKTGTFYFAPLGTSHVAATRHALCATRFAPSL